MQAVKRGKDGTKRAKQLCLVVVELGLDENRCTASVLTEKSPFIETRPACDMFFELVYAFFKEGTTSTPSSEGLRCLRLVMELACLTPSSVSIFG